MTVVGGIEFEVRLDFSAINQDIKKLEKMIKGNAVSIPVNIDWAKQQSRMYPPDNRGKDTRSTVRISSPQSTTHKTVVVEKTKIIETHRPAKDSIDLAGLSKTLGQAAKSINRASENIAFQSANNQQSDSRLKDLLKTMQEVRDKIPAQQGFFGRAIDIIRSISGLGFNVTRGVAGLGFNAAKGATGLGFNVAKGIGSLVSLPVKLAAAPVELAAKFATSFTQAIASAFQESIIFPIGERIGKALSTQLELTILSKIGSFEVIGEYVGKKISQLVGKIGGFIRSGEIDKIISSILTKLKPILELDEVKSWLKKKEPTMEKVKAAIDDIKRVARAEYEQEIKPEAVQPRYSVARKREKKREKEAAENKAYVSEKLIREMSPKSRDVTPENLSTVVSNLHDTNTQLFENAQSGDPLADLDAGKDSIAATVAYIGKISKQLAPEESIPILSGYRKILAKQIKQYIKIAAQQSKKRRADIAVNSQEIKRLQTVLSQDSKSKAAGNAGLDEQELKAINDQIDRLKTKNQADQLYSAVHKEFLGNIAGIYSSIVKTESEAYARIGSVFFDAKAVEITDSSKMQGSLGLASSYARTMKSKLLIAKKMARMLTYDPTVALKRTIQGFKKQIQFYKRSMGKYAVNPKGQLESLNKEIESLDEMRKSGQISESEYDEKIAPMKKDKDYLSSTIKTFSSLAQTLRSLRLRQKKEAKLVNSGAYQLQAVNKLIAIDKDETLALSIDPTDSIAKINQQISQAKLKIKKTIESIRKKNPRASISNKTTRALIGQLKSLKAKKNEMLQSGSTGQRDSEQSFLSTVQDVVPFLVVNHQRNYQKEGEHLYLKRINREFYQLLKNLASESGIELTEENVPIITRMRENSKAGGYYQSAKNTITLNQKTFDKISSGKIEELTENELETITHEFRHAMQYSFGKVSSDSTTKSLSENPFAVSSGNVSMNDALDGYVGTRYSASDGQASSMQEYLPLSTAGQQQAYLAERDAYSYAAKEKGRLLRDVHKKTALVRAEKMAGHPGMLAIKFVFEDLEKTLSAAQQQIDSIPTSDPRRIGLQESISKMISMKSSKFADPRTRHSRFELLNLAKDIAFIEHSLSSNVSRSAVLSKDGQATKLDNIFKNLSIIRDLINNSDQQIPDVAKERAGVKDEIAFFAEAMLDATRKINQLMPHRESEDLDVSQWFNQEILYFDSFISSLEFQTRTSVGLGMASSEAIKSENVKQIVGLIRKSKKAIFKARLAAEESGGGKSQELDQVKAIEDIIFKVIDSAQEVNSRPGYWAIQHQPDIIDLLSHYLDQLEGINAALVEKPGSSNQNDPTREAQKTTKQSEPSESAKAFTPELVKAKPGTEIAQSAHAKTPSSRVAKVQEAFNRWKKELPEVLQDTQETILQVGRKANNLGIDISSFLNELTANAAGVAKQMEAIAELASIDANSLSDEDISEFTQMQVSMDSEYKTWVAAVKAIKESAINKLEQESQRIASPIQSASPPLSEPSADVQPVSSSALSHSTGAPKSDPLIDPALALSILRANNLSTHHLKVLAKTLGVKGRSKMDRNQLIDGIVQTSKSEESLALLEMNVMKIVSKSTNEAAIALRFDNVTLPKIETIRNGVNQAAKLSQMSGANLSKSLESYKKKRKQLKSSLESSLSESDFVALQNEILRQQAVINEAIKLAEPSSPTAKSLRGAYANLSKEFQSTFKYSSKLRQENLAQSLSVNQSILGRQRPQSLLGIGGGIIGAKILGSASPASAAVPGIAALGSSLSPALLGLLGLGGAGVGLSALGIAATRKFKAQIQSSLKGIGLDSLSSNLYKNISDFLPSSNNLSTSKTASKIKQKIESSFQQVSEIPALIRNFSVDIIASTKKMIANYKTERLGEQIRRIQSLIESHFEVLEAGLPGLQDKELAQKLLDLDRLREKYKKLTGQPFKMGPGSNSQQTAGTIPAQFSTLKAKAISSFLGFTDKISFVTDSAMESAKGIPASIRGFSTKIAESTKSAATIIKAKMRDVVSIFKLERIKHQIEQIENSLTTPNLPNKAFFEKIFKLDSLKEQYQDITGKAFVHSSSRVAKIKEQIEKIEKELANPRLSNKDFFQKTAKLELLKERYKGMTAEEFVPPNLNSQKLNLASIASSASGLVLNTIKGFVAFHVLGWMQQKLMEIATQVSVVTREFETLGRTIAFIEGGESKGKSAMAFINSEVDRTGIALQPAIDGYAKLAASSRNTRLEGKATKEIFSALSQSAGVFGLTTEQTSGAILAISQMIGKGVVSAEELRGQMAERIPGAFQIAARAMGITEQQLYSMMAAGELASADFLPKFARQLSMETDAGVAGAAGTAQSALNRFNNELTRLQVAAGQRFLPIQVTSLNLLSSAMSLVAQNAETLMQMFVNVGIVFAGHGLASIYAVAKALGLAGMSAQTLHAGMGLALAAAKTFFQSQLFAMIARFAAQFVVATIAVEALKMALQAAWMVLGRFNTQMAGTKDIRDYVEGLAKSWDKVAKASQEAGSSQKTAFVAPSTGGVLGAMDDNFRGVKENALSGTAKLAVGGGLLAGGTAFLTGAGALAATVLGGTTAILGAVAAGVGFAVNKAVGLIKGNGGKYTSWADIQQEQTVLRTGEAFKTSDDMSQKAIQFAQDFKLDKGVVRDVEKLDLRINEQQIRVLTSPQGSKIREQEQAALNKLMEERKAKFEEFSVLQTQVKSQIVNTKTQINNALEAGNNELASSLQGVLNNLEASDRILARLAKTAPNPFQRMVKAVNEATDALGAMQRESALLLAGDKERIVSMQVGNFSSDINASSTANLESVVAERKAAAKTTEQLERTIKQMRQAMSDPMIMAQMKDAGMSLSNPVADLSIDSSVEQLKRAQESAASDEVKKILETAIKIKELESQLADDRIKIAENLLREKQAIEQQALTLIERNYANSEAKNKQAANKEILAVKQGQLASIGYSESAAAVDLAEVQKKTSKDSVKNIENQLSALRQAHASGKISAEQFAQKERDLNTELSNAKLAAIDAELQAREALKRKTIEDMEFISRKAQAALDKVIAKSTLLSKQTQLSQSPIIGDMEAARQAEKDQLKNESVLTTGTIQILQQKMAQQQKLRSDGLISEREYADSMMQIQKELNQSLIQQAEQALKVREIERRNRLEDIDYSRQNANLDIQIAESKAKVGIMSQFSTPKGMGDIEYEREMAKALAESKVKSTESQMQAVKNQQIEYERMHQDGLLAGREYTSKIKQIELELAQLEEQLHQARMDRRKQQKQSMLDLIEAAKKMADIVVQIKELEGTLNARLTQLRERPIVGDIESERTYNQKVSELKMEAAKQSILSAGQQMMAIEELHKKGLMAGQEYEMKMSELKQQEIQSQIAYVEAYKQSQDLLKQIYLETFEQEKKVFDFESQKAEALANYEIKSQQLRDQGLGSLEAERAAQSALSELRIKSSDRAIALLEWQLQRTRELHEYGVIAGQEYKNKVNEIENQLLQARNQRLDAEKQRFDEQKRMRLEDIEYARKQKDVQSQLIESQRTLEIKQQMLQQLKSGVSPEMVDKLSNAAMTNAQLDSAAQKMSAIEEQINKVQAANQEGLVAGREFNEKMSELKQALVDAEIRKTEAYKQSQDLLKQIYLETFEQEKKVFDFESQKSEALANYEIKSQQLREQGLGSLEAERAAQSALSELRIKSSDRAIALLEWQLQRTRELHEYGVIAGQEYNNKINEIENQLLQARNQRLDAEKQRFDEQKRMRLEDVEYARKQKDTQSQLIESQRTLEIKSQQLREQGLGSFEAERATQSALSELRIKSSDKAIASLQWQLQKTRELHEYGVIAGQEYNNKINEIENQLLQARNQRLDAEKQRFDEQKRMRLEDIEYTRKQKDVQSQLIESQKTLQIKQQMLQQLKSGVSPEMVDKLSSAAMTNAQLDSVAQKMSAIEEQINKLQAANQEGLIAGREFNEKMSELKQALVDAEIRKTELQIERQKSSTQKTGPLKLIDELENQKLQLEKLNKLEDIRRQIIQSQIELHKALTDTIQLQIQTQLDATTQLLQLSERLGSTSESSLLFRQSIESKMAKEKLASMYREQNVARQLQEMDLAKSEREAKQSKLQADIDLMSAEKALKEARRAGDKDQVSIAEKNVVSAKDALEVANKNISAQSEIVRNSRQALAVQQQLAETQAKTAEWAKSFANQIEISQAALKNQEKSLDRQRDSLQRMGSLQKAITDFSESRNQGKIDLSSRALELRQKLKSNDLAPEVQREIESQLSELGAGGKSELDIIKEKHRLEDELAQTKLTALQQEQAIAIKLQQIDLIRAEASARQAVAEAEILKSRFEQEQVTIKAELQKAEKSGDLIGVEAAKEKLDITNQQLAISAEQINNAKEQLRITQQAALETRQILELQQLAAKNQFNNQDLIRRQQQRLTEKEAQFGSTGQDGNPESNYPRYALGGVVSSGNPIIVGEDGPEIFIPRYTGTIVSNNRARAVGWATPGGLNGSNGKPNSNLARSTGNTVGVVGAVGGLGSLARSRTFVRGTGGSEISRSGLYSGVGSSLPNLTPSMLGIPATHQPTRTGVTRRLSDSERLNQQAVANNGGAGNVQGAGIGTGNTVNVVGQSIQALASAIQDNPRSLTVISANPVSDSVKILTDLTRTRAR